MPASKANPPSSPLIQHCLQSKLDKGAFSGDDCRAWSEKLDEVIAQVGPRGIDDVDAHNETALNHLVRSRRFPENFLLNGIKKLLAAGANPLAGAPAIVAGADFMDLRMKNMMEVLDKAQASGTPIHGAGGGNALHAMAVDALGWFASINGDLASDVKSWSIWINEPRASDGQTPLHVVWSVQFDKWQKSKSRSGIPMQAGLPPSMFDISQPSPSIGYVPDLMAEDQNGVRVLDLIHTALVGGILVPAFHKPFSEKILAMVENEALERNTPSVCGRPPRLPGRL